MAHAGLPGHTRPLCGIPVPQNFQEQVNRLRTAEFALDLRKDKLGQRWKVTA